MNKKIEFHKRLDTLPFRVLEDDYDKRYENDEYIIFPTHIHFNKRGVRLDAYTVMQRNEILKQYETINEPFTFDDAQDIDYAKFLG